MTDKQYKTFAIILAIVVLFFLWARKRYRAFAANNQPAQSNGLYTPEVITYAANPSAFGPQTINGMVDITVNGFNGLNQNYMPLFGFVGMAQGATWM